jgi:hypothetical protein
MLAIVGNDIVDLADPGNIGKSRDSRFVRRVFTGAEQGFIAAAGDPDVLLWALWAAKETAYKIAGKINILSVFTPCHYHVILSPGDQGTTRSGMVYSPEGPVIIRLFMTPDYVHCIGATPIPGILDHVLWDIARVCPGEEGSGHDPSMAVRRLAGRRLAALLNVPEADIDIRRVMDMDKWGPPEPYLEGQSIPLDLSLSHDGAFVAYAMLPFSSGHPADPS